MSSPPLHTVPLVPHPAVPSTAVRLVTGRVARQPGNVLALTYILEGALDRVRVPSPRPARFADELWRHTCCEMFIARKGQPGYYEFNLSPSGEWAAYAFRGVRERVPLGTPAELARLDPRIALRRRERTIELDALVPLENLPLLGGGARLVLGLAAVVEDDDGALSYWALAHPLDRPDFHHRDGFVLELDEIRH